MDRLTISNIVLSTVVGIMLWRDVNKMGNLPKFPMHEKAKEKANKKVADEQPFGKP